MGFLSSSSLMALLREGAFGANKSANRFSQPWDCDILWTLAFMTKGHSQLELLFLFPLFGLQICLFAKTGRKKGLCDQHGWYWDEVKFASRTRIFSLLPFPKLRISSCYLFPVPSGQAWERRGENMHVFLEAQDAAISIIWLFSFTFHHFAEKRWIPHMKTRCQLFLEKRRDKTAEDAGRKSQKC